VTDEERQRLHEEALQKVESEFDVGEVDLEMDVGLNMEFDV